MPYRDRGATLGPFVVGTVACSMLVWGALFSFSDAFRARVFSAVQEFRKWSPERIQQDPRGYLASAGSRSEELLGRLTDKEVLLSLQDDELELRRADAAAGVQVVSAPLEQLKAIFRRAEESDEWPVLWEGMLRHREWVQEQIVLLHHQLEDQRRRLGQVAKKADPFESQLTRIRNARQACEQQLQRVGALYEIVDSGEVSEQIVEQLSAMEQLLDGSHALLLALENEDLPEFRPTRMIPLERQVDTLAFDSILND